jgi:opacity protein-like surface antigen
MKKTILLALLLITSVGFAQQNVVASGGSFSGTGGSVSYSVGQIGYSYKTGSNGKIIEGNQQPFEISVLGTDNFTEINLQFSVIPNPTVNFLTLSINNYNLDDLSFQLYDMAGRLIKNQRISEYQTQISMLDKEAGAYLLNIIDKSSKIKSFKIIKN